MALLDIRNLDVEYELDEDTSLRAVDDVSLRIETGETFGLVGESGCGKTTLGKSIIRLLDRNGKIVDGEIRFKGEDLQDYSDQEIRDVRWAEISTVSQSAMNGMNPVYTVGHQIEEAILRHQPGTSAEAAEQRARDLLERVGIEPDRVDDYPHQFSGGMRQRAMIAMSIACDPDLIIADEPTTALDVIVQDDVLQELEALKTELDVAMLVISHDISVIAETCDRIGVMYGGKLMEVGPTTEIMRDPANPYTMGLLNSYPELEEARERLVAIPGTPPSLQEPPTTCRFADRCPFVVPQCEKAHPPLDAVDGDPNHRSACYRIDEIDELREESRRRETWIH